MLIVYCLFHIYDIYGLGKLIEGTVDQSSQIFLENDKIDEGYILTCVAFPTSNVVVEVDIEDEFYNTMSQ